MLDVVSSAFSNAAVILLHYSLLLVADISHATSEAVRFTRRLHSHHVTVTALSSRNGLIMAYEAVRAAPQTEKAYHGLRQVDPRHRVFGR